MHFSVVLPVLCLSLMATSALAEPRLIARFQIPNGSDLAIQTATPLENGTPGNVLGGLGSGLAWAGGDTFLMLPDRGPNARTYNEAVDQTTSYIPRFQTVSLKLPAAGFDAASALVKTTLLYSPTPLVYGDGKAAGLANGAPGLNTAERYYFSGRSDNFDASAPSDNPADGRLDPESLRLAPDGKSVFISDEYGPYIYQFDHDTGARIRTIALPDTLRVSVKAATGDTEISGNTRGREANRGMEGLALTLDGKTLVGIMQSPLTQDGGKAAGFTRIVTVDLISGQTRQYAYPLTNLGTAAKPKYTGVSEILAVSDHEFLVDERDGKGLGDASAAEFKHVYKIDLSAAEDVSALEGAAALASKAVTKTLYLDLVAALKVAHIDPEAIPAKIEGMTFGPDVTLDGVATDTLWIASDNDFLSTAKTPAGAEVENPNVVYVFAVP